MKTIILADDYIGTQFPCALEYGDLTGLIENEESLLDAWVLGLVAYAEDRYNVHDPVIHFEYGEASEFEVCAITGMRGNCVKTTAFILV